MDATEKRMTVEIWSDVMCPFCYIGKRKFENALEQFPDKNKIDIIWKSFQLSPDLKTDPDKNIHQFLSEHKRMPLEQAKQLNDQVTEMAKQNGLIYNFDKAVVANSFDAHRFSHLAKQHGVQDKAEEKLFAAYFTEGQNIADHVILIQMGKEIGLDPIEVENVLKNGTFAEEVKQDIEQAHEIGVRGVPFFVMNRKYAVSGAQDSKVILDTLTKAFSER